MSVERFNENTTKNILNSRWSRLNRSIFLFITLIAVALRFYRISEPRQVVFDEVHFGGFASQYLKGNYFFDVHPPLGKLIIAGIGHIYGYKGTFSFKDIGDAYETDPTVPFVQMRQVMAGFSVGSIMFALATLVEMGFSPLSLTLAGVLLAFGKHKLVFHFYSLLDNGLIVQSKFILLDGMMLFFIFGTVYCWTKFRQFRYKPFSLRWWSFLSLTGIFIAGTVGVKLVGLFTVALIGLACLYDLWELSDWKRQMSDKVLLQHFMARFITLAVIPVVLYLSFYYCHFAMLPHSGSGDAHMSIEFQKTLLGNKMHADARPVYYGQTFRIQNRAERVYLHSHVDRIPLNHLDGKVSSQGQQVNGYPIADDNNIWEIKLIESAEKNKNSDDTDNSKIEIFNSETADKKENAVDTNSDSIKSETSAKTDTLNNPADRVPIRFGDEVKICHKATGKCMLTHDVASPLTKTNMEITMFEEGSNDQEIYTHWIIESDLGDSGLRGTPIKSLGSSFNLINKEFKVKLLNYGKNLPPWGFGQRELNGCRKLGTEGDSMYSWMISDVLEPRTEEEEKEREVSMKEIKPMNFFKKFWELQTYSIIANSGLIDEHPYKSRPHEWILPSKGLGFWNDGTKARIFLLGNFVAWTLGTFGVFVFAVRFPKDKFLEHRGSVKYYQDHFFKRFGHKMSYLFGAYLLHYLPFYMMGRSLYLHHYLPSYIFSAMITAAQFDCMTRDKNPKLRLALVVLISISTIAAFVYLWPLVYGTELESDLLNKRKFIKSWNF
jgi:dolichyl-phosphate-mannose-protein mannosyltransferase